MTFTISEQVAHVNPLDTEAAQSEIVCLFNVFRTPLLRYVRAFGIHSEDGEDVVQDVFLYLYQHVQMGRSRHNLRGWIFRVAHNLALKRYKANRRQQEAAIVANGGAHAQQLVDPAPNPEEQLTAQRRTQRLLAVMSALNKQDQLCLSLRAEGLRYREIARVLGMSLGAVSISLTRSLGRMGRVDEP
jgi:RNA polymerase sigma-70 factor, ECF subfamily